MNSIIDIFPHPKLALFVITICIVHTLFFKDDERVSSSSGEKKHESQHEEDEHCIETYEIDGNECMSDSDDDFINAHFEVNDYTSVYEHDTGSDFVDDFLDSSFDDNY